MGVAGDAAKEHVKDILHRAGTEGIAPRARARAHVRTETVVVSSPLGIRENFVGLRHLFEVRLGQRVVSVRVGVVLARETAVRRFQFLGRARRLDFEDLVQVGTARHARALPRNGW